jgi:cytosine/adenosine deaminase-related metal-dependent hydrolase
MNPRALRTLTFLAALAVPLIASAQPRRPAPDAPPLPRAPGAAATIVFEHVNVVPLDRDGALLDQTVVVREGTIVSLGPGQRVAAPPGALRIDGTGRWLVPGLVDMHVHLAPGTGLPEDPAGRQLRLLLATGVTTARALIAPPTGLEVRGRIERGEQVGPRLFVYAPSLHGQNVANAADAVAKVEDAARQGFDGLKTHGSLPRPTYDAMVEAAQRAGLPLSGHVTPHVGLLRALEAGQQVEHLDGYVAALLPESAGLPAPPGQFILDTATQDALDLTRIPDLVRRTLAAGVVNGPTLALFDVVMGDVPVGELRARPEMRYVPPGTVDAWAQQLAGIGPRNAPAPNRHRALELRNRLVRELAMGGAPLLAGSDSPQLFMVPGYALHRELEALVAAGLRPEEALRAATVHAYAYLGLGDRVGTIEPRKQAELVLLEASPLEDIRNTARVAGVLTRGRWYPPEEIRGLLDEVARSAQAAPTPPPGP